MNLKSHYKIIISIIIVIILLSSFIIYYYPHHNTVYHNNGESVDVKYFHNEYPLYIFNANYSASSYSIGNRESYLNTTLTDLNYVSSPPTSAGIDSHINISMKNINTKYVYITTTGDYGNQYVEITPMGGTFPVKCKIEGNKYIATFSSLDNLHGIQIEFQDTNLYWHNANYNFTLTISAGKLYNTFNVHAEKESAIYGIVNGTGETGASYGFNDTFMVYDLNNSNFYTVNVHNGYYYFFTIPCNKYEFYSYYNNTLHNVNVYYSNSSIPHNILQAPDKSICTSIYKSNLLGN